MRSDRERSLFPTPVSGGWLALRLAFPLGVALALCVSVLSSVSSAAIVERIVAVVGERAILLSDLRQRSRPFLVRVHQQYPEGPQRAAATSQVYKVVLGRMVEEELEEEAARRAGVTVTSQDVDDAIERVALQNGLTKAAILSEARQSGLTTEQYRDEIRRQLVQAKVSNLRLQGRVKIGESDLRAAYRALVREERLSLPQRTMRLALDAGDSQESEKQALKLAERLSERAQAGEDFRALVQEYGKVGSGLAEAKPPFQEPEAIQRATLGLEVGETSKPVRLGQAVVVLQVLERSPSTLPPYAEVHDLMQERVYSEKMAKVRRHWLDGLRRRTHVEIRM